MAEPGKAKKPQVALRKGATVAGIIAELITLLETVTDDGTITDAEVAELRAWLDANRDSDLPAVDFLRTTLEQILSDGKVTLDERRALHIAVERVLPSELRQKARGRRVANELVDKAREREQKAAFRVHAAHERQRNRSVYSADFMVAGVLYDDRSATVSRYLESGHTVFLARDPENQYDRNAIEIRLKEGHQIGYVPREYASQMAPLLDAGYKQVAFCTKILRGRKRRVSTTLRHSTSVFSEYDRQAVWAC